VSLALDVAERALAILGADGYRDDDTPQDSFGPDKVAAETGMLLYAASAVRGHASIGERIERVARSLAPVARRNRVAIAIALNPSICLQLAMPHVLLSRVDSGDERFDAVLAASAGASAHLGQEVVPHRAMERAWINAVWARTPAGEDLDRAVGMSVLNHPLDLIWGSRDDAYAHTHGFMYLTDFGYADRPLPRSRDAVLAESSAVLARSLLLEDYDLTAEVLMAWPLTGAPWSPAALFGLRVLTELEDKVGILPAKNGVPEKFAELTGPERTRYAVAASYHTAFVMGILCALALRPGNAPPAQISGPSWPAGVVDELSAAVPLAATPWRETFRRLAADEQGRLAPFLLDIALLASARANDFAAVAGLLKLAVQNGLADAPVCAQAAELLQRVAVAAAAPTTPSAVTPEG
jgi:hypothetical protein